MTGTKTNCFARPCRPYIAYRAPRAICRFLQFVGQYLLKDHLGSTTVVASSAGGVLERYSYDAFGKTRNLNGSDTASTVMTMPSTRRGFTDHEMLPEIGGGMIHMNGRIYDPNLGRFMTADSVIPDPEDSQSYNRYSYVFNNPLTLTDPDGHCPVCIVILAVAGGVAASYTTTVVVAIAVGAVFGAMAAGVASDGDPRAMLQGAVIGGIMAGIGFQMAQGADAANHASNASIQVASLNPEEYSNFTGYASDGLPMFQLDSAVTTGTKIVEGSWGSAAGGTGTGIASAAGNVATSLYHATVPGAATMSSAVDYWQQGRYGWAAAYGIASVAEAGAAVLTLGQSQTLMVGTRTAVNASRGLQHLGGKGTTAYRSASGTPKSMTPRTKDLTGISAADSLENALPGLNQIIDTSKLRNLCAVCDNVSTGHVSIFPRDMSQMQGWMNSRGAAQVHPLTKELMDAVVGTVIK